MRAMKKLSLLLIMACAFVFLAGCGAKQSVGADSGKTESKAEPTSKAEVKKEYEKGVLTESSFESEFVGLKFALPEGMIMATSEDMDAMVDFGGEVIYKDKASAVLDYAKANSVYEMMAVSADQRANVMMIVEKLPLSNMTADQYITSLKTQLEGTGMGYVIDDETTTYTVGGQDFTALTTQVESSGVKMTQEYAVRKQDNRIIAIVFTTAEGSTELHDQLIAAFTAY